MESPEVNIALLGFTQTGKTCIAADLASACGSPANEHTQKFKEKTEENIKKMRKYYSIIAPLILCAVAGISVFLVH